MKSLLLAVACAFFGAAAAQASTAYDLSYTSGGKVVYQGTVVGTVNGDGVMTVTPDSSLTILFDEKIYVFDYVISFSKVFVSSDNTPATLSVDGTKNNIWACTKSNACFGDPTSAPSLQINSQNVYSAPPGLTVFQGANPFDAYEWNAKNWSMTKQASATVPIPVPASLSGLLGGLAMAVWVGRPRRRG